MGIRVGILWINVKNPVQKRQLYTAIPALSTAVFHRGGVNCGEKTAPAQLHAAAGNGVDFS